MEMLAQAAQAAAGSSGTAEIIVFWIFAVIGIGAALAMITLRNLVHSALMLVVNFFAIAALYLALQSQFLGIIQILVYAGAIMVLFLFVIMLLGVDRDDLLVDTSRWHKIGAGAMSVVVAGALLFAFVGTYTGDVSKCGDLAPGDTVASQPDTIPCAGLEDAMAAQEQESVGLVGERLFTRFTFPFEAAALLLIVATVGALILGRRHDPAPDDEVAYATDVPLPDESDLELVLASAGEAEGASAETLEPESGFPETDAAGWELPDEPDAGTDDDGTDDDGSSSDAGDDAGEDR